MTKRYLTIPEVSKILSMSEGRIRNRICEGIMAPSLVVGRRRLFPEEQFYQWVDSHMKQTDCFESDWANSLSGRYESK